MTRNHLMEPHVYWFPWATPRNRVEGATKFLNVMRKVWTILIYAEDKDHAFFKRIERYGVLRQVGKIHNYFESGGTASVFQTRDKD